MSADIERKRVVITGIGTVTSYGDGVETFWDNLLAGKSGISRVESFDVTEYASQIGSEHFRMPVSTPRMLIPTASGF